jgi:hypothetical protein
VRETESTVMPPLNEREPANSERRHAGVEMRAAVRTSAFTMNRFPRRGFERDRVAAVEIEHFPEEIAARLQFSGCELAR